MKRLFSILVIFLLIAGCAKKNEEAESTRTQVGQPVPDFSVTTIDGQAFNTADLVGKVVLINFFADWCPPCNEEMPCLEKEIWQHFKDQDFTVLSIGREHSDDEVAAFRDKKEVTFPMAADPDRSVYSLFATKFIPRNVIIDKSGKIAFQETGFDEEKLAAMTEKIEDLLK